MEIFMPDKDVRHHIAHKRVEPLVALLCAKLLCGSAVGLVRARTHRPLNTAFTRTTNRARSKHSMLSSPTTSRKVIHSRADG